MAINNIFRPGKDANPFFYNGIEIPDKYFCDRKEETEQLTKLLLSNNNIVLKAPRRLGKSSLIFHLFNQAPFKKDYNTIYVDIYPTKTIDDFVAVFYKSIADCKGIKPATNLEKVSKRLKEVRLSAEVSFPNFIKVSGSGKYDSYRVEQSLDAIFDYLSRTSKPNIVVIDEFQQIRHYGDTTLEASLRSHIQRCTNCNFIFSGSSRHMLTQMFESADKPFYRSSRPFNLGLIPEDRYADFCMEQFKSNGKVVDEQAVRLIYHIFSGNTYMMQLTMNALFQFTEKNGKATTEDVKCIIEALIDEKSDDYRVFLHNLKPDYERILLCIAAEGIAEGLFSEEMKIKYSLPAASTVSNILKKFQSEESRTIEEVSPGSYKLEDKFLELWASKYIFNNLQVRFDIAGNLFRRENQLRGITYRDKIGRAKTQS